MSLGYSASLEPSKESEFWCDVCDARCTRSPIDGTEFGHLVGCPNRPEKLKKVVHERESLLQTR